MNTTSSYESFKTSIRGKRVLVVGLGLQGGGVGVARYFSRHGALVTVTDTKNSSDLASSVDALKDCPNIKFVLGEHREKDFLSQDLIIKGPSVRWDHPLILKSSSHGIAIAMETALFVKYAPCKTIGITGTRGKSSTSQMIFEVLQRLYRRGTVYLSGNTPGTCALELLDVIKQDDVAVLELSSWQLSGFHHEQVSPHIAVLTNIYPDHLNYYHSMTEYEHDKKAIFQYQIKNDIFIDGRKFSLTDHHAYNKQCARAACTAFLGDSRRGEIDRIIETCKGLPMRQETIATAGNITVINDSTSTTPIALQTALKSFTDRPVILIMGGNAKNLPITDLVTDIRNAKQIVKIYLMPGTFTEEIKQHISGILVTDFDELVRSAVSYARGIDEPCYLLFSPAATSFAQFKNEFDRGNRFQALVSAIISEWTEKR